MQGCSTDAWILFCQTERYTFWSAILMANLAG